MKGLNFLGNIRNKVRDSKKAETDLPLKPDTAPVEPLSDNPESGTEAFAFHRERFKKIAIERNKKLSSILRTEEWIEKDAAHQEALRDDIDFEKRKGKELKAWERDTKVVIDHFRVKRDDPEGEGKKYKTLILALAGGKKVTYCAGQLTALHYMGYTDAIDGVAGISGAVAPIYYFVTGKEKGRKGTAILADEASRKDFFDPHRFNQVMDIKQVSAPIQSGPKALDTQAVLNSPTSVYVAVSRDGAQKVEWKDAKTATHAGQPDMISLLEASGNIPFFKGKGIEVNGTEYFDGGFGQIDLQELLSKFPGTTDVLILPNAPFDELENLGPTFLGKSFIKSLPKRGMPGMARKFLQMSEELRKLFTIAGDINKDPNKKVNFGILFQHATGITSTTMKSDLVEATLYESAHGTFEAFGEKDEIHDVKLFMPASGKSI